MAFSFLADAGGWQRFFFDGIALLVSGWLIYMLRKPLATLDRLGCAKVLGGALGNNLDRGAREYVVDFLDFHTFGRHSMSLTSASSAVQRCWCALHFCSHIRPRYEDSRMKTLLILEAVLLAGWSFALPFSLGVMLTGTALTMSTFKT